MATITAKPTNAQDFVARRHRSGTVTTLNQVSNTRNMGVLRWTTTPTAGNEQRSGLFTMFSGITIPDNATIEDANITWYGVSLENGFYADPASGFFDTRKTPTTPTASQAGKIINPTNVFTANYIDFGVSAAGTTNISIYANPTAGKYASKVSNCKAQILSLASSYTYDNGKMALYVNRATYHQAASEYPAGIDQANSGHGQEMVLSIEYSVPLVLVDKTIYEFV